MKKRSNERKAAVGRRRWTTKPLNHRRPLRDLIRKHLEATARADRRRRAAKCVAALVAVAPLLAALPVNGQPAPTADGLPPGIQLCGGAVAPELPPGMARNAARAGDELPPLPDWCEGTCVVDIAFLYAPEAIDPERDGFPRNVGELRRRIDAAIRFNNVAWRRAGLDAELRFVGMERDPGLNGLVLSETNGYARTRLPELRPKYGADLLYAITGAAKEEVCGIAYIRGGVRDPRIAARHGVGSIWMPCLRDNRTLAHEVGHNLGLTHDPENSSSTPYVPFGRGYLGETDPPKGVKSAAYVTNMGIRSAGSSLGRFSSSARLHGRVIGNAEVSDAARALRYTIPDATRYSPTVVPEAQEDPEDYGCLPSSHIACLNNWRFQVSSFATDRGSRSSARQVETYGLGDSAALYYFFDSANPELLVKVVNGCWLNDHWWVFGSAATDLEYRIMVGDYAGDPATWNVYRHVGDGVIVGDNGYSTGAGVINDTKAFRCSP